MRVFFATTVPVSRQAAWAFAAEFANIGKWDPGVKAAKKARAHGRSPLRRRHLGRPATLWRHRSGRPATRSSAPCCASHAP